VRTPAETRLEPIDIAAMRRIAARSYEAAIENAFGAGGMENLRKLLEFLTEFYALRDPENLGGLLHVVSTSSDLSIEQHIRSEQAPQRPDQLDRVRISEQGESVVQLKGYDYLVWTDVHLDVTEVSKLAPVYTFGQKRESFTIAATKFEMERISPALTSIFSRPRFSSLLEALRDYRDRIVRASSCFILERAWEDKNSRVFFAPKPEVQMRRSLHQHLRAVLSDATTRPEQVVDETHPVDLRVDWDFSLQEAIIEIKWLGASRDAGHITVRYSASRAIEGANQLAKYLGSTRSSAPNRETRGYLVVIDARRRGLSDSTTTVSRENGFYYENREITYSPDHAKLRVDFEEPIRMFVEPG
jgi:hypothetical protein